MRIPDTARADGWMSHDATQAVVMKKGSYVKLSTASIPLPTVSSYNSYSSSHTVNGIAVLKFRVHTSRRVRRDHTIQVMDSFRMAYSIRALRTIRALHRVGMVHVM